MLGSDSSGAGGMMRVYIGYDSRELEAYKVAAQSLEERASMPVDVIPLCADRLTTQRLLQRPVDARGGMYDLVSNARQSTEFAVSRFMVPFLAQHGWALFVDCDVVFQIDVAELFALADPSKAVQVVQHQYAPVAGTKMDGQPQTVYPRKNWSSVILWNCDHPANQRLTLDDVNRRRGLELHQFYWLHDEEIGALPARFNWLVGEQEPPQGRGIAHFTRGGPWLSTWAPTEYDEIWLEEATRCKLR